MSDQGEKKSITLEPDRDGIVWLDIQTVKVEIEGGPPHRLAIVASYKPSPDSPSTSVWVRFQRPDSYNLKQKIADALENATAAGAEEIIQTLRLAACLNGGAETATGRMVLFFQGESGLKHRVLLPRDQSGLLSDFLNMAASKAAEIADQKVKEATTEIVKIEATPVDAEVVALQYSPLTGKEFISVRLQNGLEYSFVLSPEQAQGLRRSKPPPQADPSSKQGPMN